MNINMKKKQVSNQVEGKYLPRAQVKKMGPPVDISYFFFQNFLQFRFMSVSFLCLTSYRYIWLIFLVYL